MERASDDLSRRECLTRGAALLGTAVAGDLAAGDAPQGKQIEEAKRAVLRRLLYSRQDLDAWLAGKAFPFAKYDPDLGYLHPDRDFKEGMDGAICSYRYDRLGARRTIAHADKRCRINTYGDSFTSCEQVSDGETWQEVLASHLGEPIRNYGIGGYSVYLAYLRLKREEQRSPAPYILFNIFDDDHYRNLIAWQRLRGGIGRKSIHPPTPSVRVDPDAGTFVEQPNPCPTKASLYDLCDFDEAWRRFKDDYLLEHYVLRELHNDRKTSDFDDAELTHRALYASMRIIEKVEEFAAREKRRVLYILSYSGPTIRKWIEGGGRFDQSFVDFLDKRRLPYVDLLKAHAADYAKFAPGIDAYLSRYYVGHYNPLGNHFCAFAIKDKVVRMLQPRPTAYAPGNYEF